MRRRLDRPDAGDPGRLRRRRAVPGADLRNRTRLGTPKNFERAIGLTTGAIIALADQDDVWYPHKLKRLERELARSKRIGWCSPMPTSSTTGCARQATGCGRHGAPSDATDGSFARGRLFEALVRDNLVTGCTAAFRSDYKDLVIPVPAACAHDPGARWS